MLSTKYFPGGAVVKNLLPMQETQETWVRSLVGKIAWRRTWQPASVFLPGESHRLMAWWATVHKVANNWTWQATEHARTFHCMDIPYLSIHLPVAGHLDCFHFLAIMNNAAGTISMEVSVDICFYFSWILPGSGIAGLYDFLANIMMNCQTVSKVAVPFYIPISIQWLFLFFHIFTNMWYCLTLILVSTKWHFTVVSNCIFLMTDDIKYLFVCLSAIYKSSLVKSLLISFLHLKNWIICLLINL